MSVYHIIGISQDGRLDVIVDGDSWATVCSEALECAPHFRQLFLIQNGVNARELTFTPEQAAKLEAGDFSPEVRHGKA